MNGMPGAFCTGGVSGLIGTDAGIGDDDIEGINGGAEIGGMSGGGVGPAGIRGVFEGAGAGGGTRGGVTDLSSGSTPFGTAGIGGTAGSTCMAPGMLIESFFLPGGSSSGGRQLGIAYFSRALYTRCIACGIKSK